MKICFLNHDVKFDTGAGRFCLALLASIKKQTPDLQYRVFTHATHPELLPRRWWQAMLVLPKLRKVFGKYDIVHALDGWPYGFLAAVAAYGLGKKLVITAIGTGAVQPLYQPLKKILLGWAYRQADVVTAVSGNTRDEIRKVIPSLAIEVINHGVDAGVFQKAGPASAYIRTLQPYILSVGALKKRKGYFYSIQAFVALAKELPRLKYVIVGGGPERPALNKQIEEAGLTNRVVFFESVDEVTLKQLYQNAELFILLSQNINHDIEGFGLVFLEAAAAGLPCVGTKESGSADAIQDGRTGFLVPQTDSMAAAKKISEILSDQKLKKSFGEQATAFAKTKNWDRAAKEYLRVYSLLN